MALLDFEGQVCRSGSDGQPSTDIVGSKVASTSCPIRISSVGSNTRLSRSSAFPYKSC